MRTTAAAATGHFSGEHACSGAESSHTQQMGPTMQNREMEVCSSRSRPASIHSHSCSQSRTDGTQAMGWFGTINNPQVTPRADWESRERSQSVTQQQEEEEAVESNDNPPKSKDRRRTPEEGRQQRRGRERREREESGEEKIRSNGQRQGNEGARGVN